MLTTPLPPARALARILHFGETPLDTFGEWVVVLRPEPAGGWRRPWSSYRVARPKPKTGRGSFWLASDGRRMARWNDWTVLLERHPDVAAWAAGVAINAAKAINDTATVAAIEGERATDEATRWGPE